MFVCILGSTGVGRRCSGRRSVFDHRDGHPEERWFRGGCCHRGTAVPGRRTFAHFRHWRVSCVDGLIRLFNHSGVAVL